MKGSAASLTVVTSQSFPTHTIFIYKTAQLPPLKFKAPPFFVIRVPVYRT